MDYDHYPGPKIGRHEDRVRKWTHRKLPGILAAVAEEGAGRKRPVMGELRRDDVIPTKWGWTNYLCASSFLEKKGCGPGSWSWSFFLKVLCAIRHRFQETFEGVNQKPKLYSKKVGRLKGTQMRPFILCPEKWRLKPNHAKFLQCWGCSESCGFSNA